MRKKQVDRNQADIVETLRAAGAEVVLLHTVGEGVPDLLVGYQGEMFLIEVKGPKGKLTQRQVEWFTAWYRVGCTVIVARSPDDAIRAIGATMSMYPDRSFEWAP